MDGIMAFFKGIGDVIVGIIDFVVSFFRDLIYVISLLGNMLLQLPNMIGWLPSACISLTVTLFGIVIIYKIMGREG